MKPIDLVMSLILLGVFLFLSKVEIKDIKCPTPDSSDRECKLYGGMCYSYTSPEPSDGVNQLLSKISKASFAESSSIKWRRALLLSIIICFWIWFLIIIPIYEVKFEWYSFYLSVVVSFSFIYMNFNYYSYHVFRQASLNSENCINDLKNKVKI